MHWSQFKGFEISFPSGRANELRPQFWRDTYMGAVGFGYRFRPGTEVTAGVSYDTAVTSGGNNTLSPDGDRILIGIGLNQVLGEKLRLSVSFSHMFVKDASVAVNTARDGMLIGTASSGTSMFGVTLRKDW